MKKLLHFLVVCLFVCVCFYAGTILADRRVLSEQWVRIHVVANSDSREDQALKLQVRNGILEKLESVADDPDSPMRMENLQKSLPEIERTACEILKQSGCEAQATVTLEKESFPRRDARNLRLPAGVYQTLRITIGEGQGHNWWGVLFPQLCYGEEENVSASLTGSLTGKDNIRFFFLEKLGQLENRWKEREKGAFAK